MSARDCRRFFAGGLKLLLPSLTRAPLLKRNLFLPAVLSCSLGSSGLEAVCNALVRNTSVVRLNISANNASTDHLGRVPLQLLKLAAGNPSMCRPASKRTHSGPPPAQAHSSAREAPLVQPHRLGAEHLRESRRRPQHPPGPRGGAGGGAALADGARRERHGHGLARRRDARAAPQ